MSNSITIYENKNYSGKRLRISLANKGEGILYSIEKNKLNDKMSSIKWDIPSNVRIIFYEHSDGTGRKYIRGGGQSGDADTHNNDFKDCASAYRWYYENPPVTAHYLDLSKNLTRQFFDGLFLSKIQGKPIYYVKQTELNSIGTQILQITFHLKVDAPIFSDPSLKLTVDTKIAVKNNAFSLEVLNVKDDVDSDWIHEIVSLGLQEILVDNKVKKIRFFGNTRGTPRYGGEVKWKSFSQTE